MGWEPDTVVVPIPNGEVTTMAHFQSQRVVDKQTRKVLAPGAADQVDSGKSLASSTDRKNVAAARLESEQAHYKPKVKTKIANNNLVAEYTQDRRDTDVDRGPQMLTEMLSKPWGTNAVENSRMQGLIKSFDWQDVVGSFVLEEALEDIDLLGNILERRATIQRLINIWAAYLDRLAESEKRMASAPELETLPETAAHTESTRERMLLRHNVRIRRVRDLLNVGLSLLYMHVYPEECVKKEEEATGLVESKEPVSAGTYYTVVDLVRLLSESNEPIILSPYITGLEVAHVIKTLRALHLYDEGFGLDQLTATETREILAMVLAASDELAQGGVGKALSAMVAEQITLVFSEYPLSADGGVWLGDLLLSKFCDLERFVSHFNIIWRIDPDRKVPKRVSAGDHAARKADVLDYLREWLRRHEPIPPIEGHKVLPPSTKPPAKLLPGAVDPTLFVNSGIKLSVPATNVPQAGWLLTTPLAEGALYSTVCRATVSSSDGSFTPLILGFIRCATPFNLTTWLAGLTFTSNAFSWYAPDSDPDTLVRLYQVDRQTTASLQEYETVFAGSTTATQIYVFAVNWGPTITACDVWAIARLQAAASTAISGSVLTTPTNSVPTWTVPVRVERKVPPLNPNDLHEADHHANGNNCLCVHASVPDVGRLYCPFCNLVACGRCKLAWRVGSPEHMLDSFCACPKVRQSMDERGSLKAYLLEWGLEHCRPDQRVENREPLIFTYSADTHASGNRNGMYNDINYFAPLRALADSQERVQICDALDLICATRHKSLKESRVAESVSARPKSSAAAKKTASPKPADALPKDISIATAAFKKRLAKRHYFDAAKAVVDGSEAAFLDDLRTGPWLQDALKCKPGAVALAARVGADHDSCFRALLERALYAKFSRHSHVESDFEKGDDEYLNWLIDFVGAIPGLEIIAWDNGAAEAESARWSRLMHALLGNMSGSGSRLLDLIAEANPLSDFAGAGKGRMMDVPRSAQDVNFKEHDVGYALGAKGEKQFSLDNTLMNKSAQEFVKSGDPMAAVGALAMGAKLLTGYEVEPQIDPASIPATETPEPQIATILAPVPVPIPGSVVGSVEPEPAPAPPVVEQVVTDTTPNPTPAPPALVETVLMSEPVVSMPVPQPLAVDDLLPVVDSVINATPNYSTEPRLEVLKRRPGRRLAIPYDADTHMSGNRNGIRTAGAADAHYAGASSYVEEIDAMRERYIDEYILDAGCCEVDAYGAVLQQTANRRMHAKNGNSMEGSVSSGWASANMDDVIKRPEDIRGLITIGATGLKVLDPSDLSDDNSYALSGVNPNKNPNTNEMAFEASTRAANGDLGGAAKLNYPMAVLLPRRTWTNAIPPVLADTAQGLYLVKCAEMWLAGRKTGPGGTKGHLDVLETQKGLTPNYKSGVTINGFSQYDSYALKKTEVVYGLRWELALCKLWCVYSIKQMATVAAFDKGAATHFDKAVHNATIAPVIGNSNSPIANDNLTRGGQVINTLLPYTAKDPIVRFWYSYSDMSPQQKKYAIWIPDSFLGQNFEKNLCLFLALALSGPIRMDTVTLTTSSTAGSVPANTCFLSFMSQVVLPGLSEVNFVLPISVTELPPGSQVITASRMKQVPKTLLGWTQAGYTGAPAGTAPAAPNAFVRLSIADGAEGNLVNPALPDNPLQTYSATGFYNSWYDAITTTDIQMFLATLSNYTSLADEWAYATEFMINLTHRFPLLVAAPVTPQVLIRDDDVYFTHKTGDGEVVSETITAVTTVPTILAERYLPTTEWNAWNYLACGLSIDPTASTVPWTLPAWQTSNQALANNLTISLMQGLTTHAMYVSLGQTSAMHNDARSNNATRSPRWLRAFHQQMWASSADLGRFGQTSEVWATLYSRITGAKAARLWGGVVSAGGSEGGGCFAAWKSKTVADLCGVAKWTAVAQPTHFDNVIPVMLADLWGDYALKLTRAMCELPAGATGLAKDLMGFDTSAKGGGMRPRRIAVGQTTTYLTSEHAASDLDFNIIDGLYDNEWFNTRLGYVGDIASSFIYFDGTAYSASYFDSPATSGIWVKQRATLLPAPFEYDTLRQACTLFIPFNTLDGSRIFLSFADAQLPAAVQRVTGRVHQAIIGWASTRSIGKGGIVYRDVDPVSILAQLGFSAAIPKALTPADGQGKK